MCFEKLETNFYLLLVGHKLWCLCTFNMYRRRVLSSDVLNASLTFWTQILCLERKMGITCNCWWTTKCSYVEPCTIQTSVRWATSILQDRPRSSEVKFTFFVLLLHLFFSCARILCSNAFMYGSWDNWAGFALFPLSYIYDIFCSILQFHYPALDYRLKCIREISICSFLH